MRDQTEPKFGACIPETGEANPLEGFSRMVCPCGKSMDFELWWRSDLPPVHRVKCATCGFVGPEFSLRPSPPALKKASGCDAANQRCQTPRIRPHDGPSHTGDMKCPICGAWGADQWIDVGRGGIVDWARVCTPCARSAGSEWPENLEEEHGS